MVKEIMRLFAAASMGHKPRWRSDLARFATAGADPMRKRSKLESWAALSLGSAVAPRRARNGYKSCGLQGDMAMLNKDLTYSLHVVRGHYQQQADARGRIAAE